MQNCRIIKNGCCLRTILILTAAALAPLQAQGMSGTTQVAWPGTPVVAQPGWPDGVLALLNDPLRTEGWNPWFSEWPNDLNRYAFKIRRTEEVNHLIEQLAAIKATNIQVRLSPDKEPRSLGFTTVLKEKNGIAVLFSLGNQKMIDAWYQRLPEAEPGVRKFGVHTYRQPPVAMPPTLTIYAGHKAIDLQALQVPQHVEVIAEIAKADPGKGQNASLLKAIADFAASHAAKAAPRLKPSSSTKP